MSFENFKPVVWSKFIQTELEKKCKLVEDCNRKFEGEAKRGQKVKILGVGEVKIGDYDGSDIGSPQVVDDESLELSINKAKFFNFAVDDIDKAQSLPGLMEALLKDATKRIAITRDSYVASLAKKAKHITDSTAIPSAKSAKKAIDEALLVLRENDVDITDDVVINIPYFLYQLFKDEIISLGTSNMEWITKGIVGTYDNAKVKVTNNLYNDGTDTYAMVRTSNAIAFAGGIDKIEPYRPQGTFSDAIKGLNCFGAKIIRPKELVTIKVHK